MILLSVDKISADDVPVVGVDEVTDTPVSVSDSTDDIVVVSEDDNESISRDVVSWSLDD